MLLIGNKYKTKVGILFLGIYLSFFFLGTLHYHKYDLDVKSSYSDTPMSDAYNDLTSDFLSICSLHQFAQTIDDFHYCSSDIIQSLSELNTNLSQIQINNFSADEYSQSTPRAPPFSP